MFIPAQKPVQPERRGIVLLSVLVVLVVLTLAAYQYSEYMMAEYQAADSHMKMTQTKALAWSGVNYMAVSLSNSDYFINTLNSNPYDNPQYFQGIPVGTANNPNMQGNFTIVSLLSPDNPLAQNTPYRYGVCDESSKINLNALLQYDSTGTVGYNMLMSPQLQTLGMTDEIANSILDWLDPTTTTPRSSGAKDEYYMQLSPPYHVKNGPMDSIEELLLVKGMTPQLLFGNDYNRNGILDPNEQGIEGSGTVDLGWSPYFTVYSREPNTDSSGNPRLYLNSSRISTLSTQLNTLVGQNMTTFVLAYRFYGGTAAAGAAAAGTADADDSGAAGATTGYQAPNSSDAAAVSQVIQTQVSNASSSSTPPNLKSISSIYSLINSTVSVPVGSGNTAHNVSLSCPLADPGQQAQLLPIMLDETTTSQAPDLTPRININNAGPTVLGVLPGLTATQVQQIITAQNVPSPGAAPPTTYNTTAWLLQQKILPVATLQSLERFITARSSVYRFQSIGFLTGGGPTTRLEAVVDVNNGRPRVVYLRDITELGRGGFVLTSGGNTDTGITGSQ